MPSRIARTQTAVRVAEFLATREGKQHLAQHGWVKGTPVVMTNAQEKLSDAMAMVSVHGRPVFLAMIDPETDHLQMLYVTTPQTALTVVDAASTSKTSADFFKEVVTQGSREFRVSQWDYTAVAFAVPSCDVMQSAPKSNGRYQLPGHNGALMGSGRNRVLERV